MSPSPLNADTVRKHLAGLAPAFDVVVVRECASTNTELIDAPPGDDGRIHVLATEIQTAGRGRRGRQWLSWEGASLSFSAMWYFAPAAPVPAGLSLVAGIAVAAALEKMGVAGVQLKWPNDVLVCGAKLAGILVELVPGRGRTPAAVIGIGINLHLPPGATVPDQAQVTDLASQVGKLPDRNLLLANLLAELHALFETYATAGFSALRGAWEQRNAHADLPVRVVGEGSELSGICSGVDEDGALMLRTDTGTMRILSGEVSLRIGQCFS